MKIIDKTLYLRAIWFIVAGIFALLVGIRYYAAQPKSLDDLQSINGRVTDIQYRKLFSEEIKTTQSSIVFYVDSMVSVYTYYSGNLKILDTVQIQIGDSCQFWVDMEIRKDMKNGETQKYIIRAMNINNEEIIPFKRHGYLAISIFLYALILFIPALFFVLKHPEILFGQENDNAKGD